MADDTPACDELFADAVECVVRAGMRDPCFRRAWLLARSKRLDVSDTLFFVHTLTTEPSAVRWDRLGHPNTERCRDISRTVRQAAAVLERTGTPADTPQSGSDTQEPDQRLLVYACTREFLPCGLDDVVAALGAESTVLRLRHFADIVDRCLLVG